MILFVKPYHLFILALCQHAKNQSWLYDLFEQGFKKKDNADKRKHFTLNGTILLVLCFAFRSRLKCKTACLLIWSATTLFQRVMHMQVKRCWARHATSGVKELLKSFVLTLVYQN